MAPKPIGVQPRLGDIKYVDINGDGAITADDYVRIARSRMPGDEVLAVARCRL